MPCTASTPANEGSSIENANGSACCLLHLAVVVELLDKHLVVLHRRYPCVGDPLDVTLTQLRFEQALGIADAAQTHVADVRLGA